MTEESETPKTKTPDISTRFGGERANPQGVGIQKTAYSVINSLRYLSKQEIDIEDPDSIKKILGRKVTVAQMAAIRTIEKANLGYDASIERLTTAVDGPTPTVTINTELNADERNSEAAAARAYLLRGAVHEAPAAGTDEENRLPNAESADPTSI